MKKKRIVVALGGNALGNCPGEQILAVRKAAEVIALLVEQGHEVIIGHGNGPQVGMINSAMNYDRNQMIKFQLCHFQSAEQCLKALLVITFSRH